MKDRRPLIHFFQAVAERVPLEKASLEELIIKKEVPRHRMSWAYYLGGLALFFLLIQFVTGLMLLFYYLPTISDANASMEFIEKYVSGADFMRNLHIWSASFLVFFALAHLLTAFAMKAYEKPREITWIMGVVLLLIIFAFGFSGYVLPWTQVGVNATKVVFQSMQKTGDYLPGPLAQWPKAFRELIQGEPAIAQATLSRLFALHVVILPLLVIVILAIHLLLVQLHGMSQGVARPTGKTERFFPFFALKDFSLWGLFFFITFILAATIPFESFYSYPLFEPYDALGGTPDGIKPEWYFYFVYYPLEILPFWLVTLLLLICMVLLFLTPAVFKGLSRRSLGTIAVLAFIYLLVITLLGQPIRDLIKGGA